MKLLNPRQILRNVTANKIIAASLPEFDISLPVKLVNDSFSQLSEKLKDVVPYASIYICDMYYNNETCFLVHFPVVDDEGKDVKIATRFNCERSGGFYAESDHGEFSEEEAFISSYLNLLSK